MPSSSGSIASGGTTEPVMMISPRAQPLAEPREHIGHVAHDIDPLAGIGLRIAGARELGSAADDAAGETI